MVRIFVTSLVGVLLVFLKQHISASMILHISTCDISNACWNHREYLP
jgi:hypothetical protein